MIISRNRLISLAVCGMASLAFAESASAASCAASLIPYRSAQALQKATAPQVRTQVFDQIQRHNCPTVGLNVLDYYISILRKQIAAYDAAYPCQDGQGHNEVVPSEKKEPHLILEKSLEARKVCLQYLNARPVQVAPGDPPPPVTMDQLRRSHACRGSDITGLPGVKPTPKQNDCRQGGQSLKFARKFRKEYPALAPAEFKKSADAYRRAGDIDLANLIIAEMNALPLDYPDESEAQRNFLQRAGFEQDYARKLEESNRTSCDGLRAALPHYSEAASMFREAKEVGQANLNAARYRELSNHVDRNCRAANAPPPASPTSSPPPPPGPKKDTACEAGLKAVEQLEKLADFQESMTSVGTVNPEVDRLRTDAERQRENLAAQGCK